jgi:glycosyltransferase involved in cell wall biosynthesis
MKISLLIPVFDYDIVALVHSMKSALTIVPELCEVLIGDDGSSDEYRQKYMSLEGDGVRVILEANGDFLLFIDADAMFSGTAEAYLLKWLPFLNVSPVICGGTLYQDSAPGDPDKLLRWKYGKSKEQRKAAERNKHPHSSFSTFNVIISKTIFSKIRFNEELKQYGHEDTLMGYQFKKAGIKILHVDNGLMHEGLESNKDFLNKTKLGIENLSKLFDNVTDKKAFSETVRMIRVYNKLNFFRLTRILAGLFIRYRDRMEIRLDSSDISMSLFGFYKICMFCTYREIHRRRHILPIL